MLNGPLYIGHFNDFVLTKDCFKPSIMIHDPHPLFLLAGGQEQLPGPARGERRQQPDGSTEALL